MTAIDDAQTDGWTAPAAVVASEMAVVGAALHTQAGLEEAADLLAAADFHSIAGTVYAAALDLLTQGKPVGPAAVLHELTLRGDINRIGGGGYLTDLMRHAVPVPAIGYHAAIIRDDARRRRMHQACASGQQLTAKPGWGGDVDVDQIRKLVDEAARDSRHTVVQDVAGEMAALLDDLENPPPAPAGIAPPYSDLTHLLGGFQPGQLIVVGARPSVGKSTFAVDVIRRAAVRDGHLAVLHTLEMTRREVMQRMLAAESGVQLKSIREATLSAHELERVVDPGMRISGARLIVDDQSGCSLEHVRASLRSLARTGQAGIVVIDYLQLMTPPKASNREQEVAALSRGLKLLAMEFAVPIMLLSQLNREAEKRSDKRPQPSDLRESGAVEQDADVIILLHRDDAHDRESPRAGEADLIVAKHRNGPTGVITVGHQLHYARFVDLAWSPTKGLT